MLLTVIALAAATAQTQAAPEVLKEGLAIRGVARSGRIPFPADAVQALFASGKWKDPKAGDEVALPNGEKRAWTALKADANGAIDQAPYQGGYACFQVQRGSDEVDVLEASGHGVVYVNGEPFAGDPYGNRYLKLPVALKTGTNTLLFSAGRGNLTARLARPQSKAQFNMSDLTLRDQVVGRSGNGFLGIQVLNCTTEPLVGLSVWVRVEGGEKVKNELPTLPPLCVFKAPLFYKAATPEKEGSAEISFTLVGPQGMLDFQKATMRVRRPDQTYKVTYYSDADGSVQYFAVNPALKKPGPKALIMSPHGASVEAIGQADAYSSKDWANLVAPTNRRPFGFDWEDWGEEDAMQVLDIAEMFLGADRSRIYLSGHSMGGHGTWHLGATYPDRFAAIGPSAGWVSFFSYAGAPRTAPANPVEELFYRSMNGSDTLGLKKNFLMENIYILHGEKDDNVPVTEARTMKQVLTDIGAKFEYHEQPGAGHWWDGDAAPGADCVDWPPMMKLFQDSRLLAAKSVPRVDFVTFDPGRSGTCYWARIEGQLSPMALSEISIERLSGRLKGTTKNVSRLSILPDGVDWTLPVFVAELDGQTVSAPLAGIKKQALSFQLLDGKWVSVGTAPLRFAGVRRHLFKSAFRNLGVLVYGTHGTPEENAWALAKARFDAETFLYRGNGAFPMISDDEALRTFGKLTGGSYLDRNFVLYGNASTNSAYGMLLKGSPIRVESGKLRVGSREERGKALGCVFLYPRSGSRFGMVGVVGGTGIEGMRLADRLPYFVSGVQYPDWCVFGPEIYTKGTGGVIGAGFFDDQWKVTQKESAWRAK